jgi:DNA-binding MarR family transcriptional regulator
MPDFKDSDHYQVTWLIRRVFRAMGHTADKYLETLGISVAERAVLEFLYPDKKLSVPQIAEQYRVSRQHVQVTVNSLIEKKLIGLEENPRHKRSQLVTLNNKGQRMFTKVSAKDKQVIKKLFLNVTDAECKRVRHTLSKLLNNLSEVN